ncbi:MAG: protein kinase domain-containing protein [Pirellulaceae bacterium]
MDSNSRVFELLEEVLNTGRTPEDVCHNCPELLPEVCLRWNAFRRIDAEFGVLLPTSDTTLDAEGMQTPPRPTELPQIPGYRVECVLGQGGMGIVYRAWHFRLDRGVALKMLLAGPYARPHERERFLGEAQAVAALRHPNIVQVHDAGEVDGQAFFTMELVEGGDLADRFRGVPQPARKAADLVATIACAVQVAHEAGIVHRDLKPNNILLTKDGTPKVTDFGLARRMETDGDLTYGGATMGTPSYMAPEQARGQKDAIGPATDVYALGTILYELLTGRPPFRAESPTATLQQVVMDEPLSPSRLNPRIPRDLDTICLKCLHKEPHKRYASAQALVDDLRRFDHGEPIMARPVGPLERGVRWVRRRPTLAGALSAGVLLGLALIITVLWWHGQQKALEAEAVAYAEADLSESVRLRDRGEFKASAASLQRAKERLREFVPPELRDRLSTAFAILELVTRLDAIRLERAQVKPPAETLSVLVLPMTKTINAIPSGRHYEKEFRDAGIGAPGDDPAVVAARVRNSPVSQALVATLDDWIACAADGDQQAWVLAVLRQADPDPWRNRVRDPATWENPLALGELAAQARLNEQSSHLLAVLGARLRAKKIDAVPFLSRVTAAYPHDFWVNIELGNAFLDQSKAVEAVESYRAALELRPGTTSVHYALGCMYLGMHRSERCIAEFEQAIHLDPNNAWCHNRLGVAWALRGGHDDEAIAQYRESIRLDPTIGWTHHHLAVTLERQGHLEMAAAGFQEAARLFPEKRAEWKRDMRRMLMRLGRGADVHTAWKKELTAHPTGPDDWLGYAELCLFLKDEVEYRRVRRDLLAQFGATNDPDVAERTGRACLLLPPSADELRQAVALTERAVAVGRAGHEYNYPYYRFAEGLARYRQGRFDDAIALMTGDAAQSLGACPRLLLALALRQQGRTEEARSALQGALRQFDWTPLSADHHDIWTAHILRREAEAMIQVDEPTVREKK